MRANAASHVRLTLKWLCFTLFAMTCQASATPHHSDDEFTVAILLFDEVQIIDFSAPYEIFGQADFNVFTVSKTGTTVTTAMGLSVNPAYSFATMPDADAILVPGGDVHNAMQDKDIIAWLRHQQTGVDHIVSVCTGSHIVAESGLLDGLSATTFHKALDSFRADYPAIRVQPEKRFVDNGQIITSAGLSSGIDASLHLVSKVRGLDKARSVALHVEYDWDPDGQFVRAMMADRYFPDNRFDWPEGIRFNQLSSVGDTTTWTKVFAATTSASAKQLAEVYLSAMSQHSSWTPLETQQENHFSWQGEAENAQWQHHFSVETAGNDSRYYLTISMQQIQG